MVINLAQRILLLNNNNNNTIQMEMMFRQMHLTTVQIFQRAVQAAQAKNLWMKQVCMCIA